MNSDIRNLSFDAEVEDIFGVFSTYGEVTTFKLPLERETGRERGFAFVDMGDKVKNQKAIDNLQDVESMGRAIMVTKARTKNNELDLESFILSLANLPVSRPMIFVNLS